MNDPNFPRETVIMVSSMAQLAAVYALLGGASVAAISHSGAGKIEVQADKPAADKPAAEPAPDAGAAEPSDDTIDAAGWPWDAALHASTKGMTKDGLWRMKVGVSRPDPKPGFPKADATAQTGGTGTASNGAASQASGTVANDAAGAGDDEDEFAAFRAAADKANGTDAAAAAGVAARKWTDADLGALCNQAAVKLGDPAPVKALIAEYCAEGVVPHSRNIADDQREAFAQAVEKKADITFAG